MPGVVLFCSSAIWSQHADDVLAVAPDIQVVPYTPGVRVGADDIARVTVAFASDDLYPDGLPGFFRVCLDAPALEWVQLFNAGIDHPVFGLMLDRGLRLTTASGTTAIPIAHHVIMMLLALARDLPRSLADQRRHEWQPRQLEDLEGRTVGVLGMGPIGAEVARLTEHLGMTAIGMRRTVTGFEPCETWTFERFDELLATVDDLVLALPLTDDTRGLIGRRELSLLPAGARVVNVGRGELIDEAALVDALAAGRLGGAGLDVFVTEPLPADSPLWDLPNVILTPHHSGDTPISTQRVNELFLANLRRFAAGDELHNEVASDVATRQPPR